MQGQPSASNMSDASLSVSDVGATPPFPESAGYFDVHDPKAIPSCVESFLKRAFASHSFESSYGKQGKGKRRLESPHGLTVTGTGKVLVADTGNHRIVILQLSSGDRDKDSSKSTGKLKLTFVNAYGTKGNGNGQFKFPHAVAEVPAGRILVADSGNNRIVVLKLEGKKITYQSSFGPSLGHGINKFDFPRDLAVTAGGAVLVADINNHRIVVLQLENNNRLVHSSTFGSEGRGDQEFEYPYAIVATQGAAGTVATVLVADMCSSGITLLHLLADGKNLKFQESSSEFKFPHGLAITARGAVLVADNERHRIVVLQMKPFSH